MTEYDYLPDNIRAAIDAAVLECRKTDKLVRRGCGKVEVYAAPHPQGIVWGWKYAGTENVQQQGVFKA